MTDSAPPSGARAVAPVQAPASPEGAGDVLRLTLCCKDKIGIVAAVAGFIAARGGSIMEASQFSDASDGQFYLRMEFRLPAGAAADAVVRDFADVAASFSMAWDLANAQRRPRTLILASKFGHCLYDLVHRWRAGSLPVDLLGVVSNHDDLRAFVEWNGLPFHYLPVSKESRPEQERQVLAQIASVDAELVVLARYMQILSPEFCEAVAGRCINIHHSFLPGFKGARPYHQAHKRGVKIIGATAHYVTPDLDEGPIIEQAVERVHHGHTPESLIEIGRDLECSVLARAVKWHAERRVLLRGDRTVVFS